MIRKCLRRLAHRLSPSRRWRHVERNVLEVRSLDCLKTAMGWTEDPILEGEHLRAFDYFEDLNERRLRDAEVIAAACCNGDPKTLVEIGTAHGRTTALMARNAPTGTVHTVNAPPDVIARRGRHVTFAPSCEEIGRYYREQGHKNVRQVFADSAKWKPDLDSLEVAFIDGCHDAGYVYHDTRKILNYCKPGSLILWHDFAPKLAPVYPWIADVVTGVERLYRRRLLRGRILHLQDSWVGLYRVPNGGGSS
ncbi:MAG: class I SAM-dependent methyltransferase [Planctomycetota bacterium]|jgi:predicted O-methyltransferase YrrM